MIGQEQLHCSFNVVFRCFYLISCPSRQNSSSPSPSRKLRSKRGMYVHTSRFTIQCIHSLRIPALHASACHRRPGCPLRVFAMGQRSSSRVTKTGPGGFILDAYMRQITIGANQSNNTFCLPLAAANIVHIYMM